MNFIDASMSKVNENHTATMTYQKSNPNTSKTIMASQCSFYMDYAKEGALQTPSSNIDKGRGDMYAFELVPVTK